MPEIAGSCGPAVSAVSSQILISRTAIGARRTEPEDVQAHLVGGIPEGEVVARKRDFARFGVETKTLFRPERPGVLAFLPTRCSTYVSAAGHRRTTENKVRHDGPRPVGRQGAA